jgi:putative inorganic carbon (hco3(-)) transporter
MTARRPEVTLPILELCAAVALALALVLPGNVPLATGVVVLGGVVWSTYVTLNGELRPIRTVLLIPGAVFSCAVAASALLADAPSRFSIDLALAPLSAALVCGLLRRRDARRIAADTLLGLLTLLGLASLWLKVTDVSTGVALQRGEDLTQRVFPGAFGHPNQYAAVLVLLLPFAAVRLLRDHGLRRWVAAVPLALGATALFLTYSRGFWLACVVSAVVLAASRRERLVVLGTLGSVGALFAPQIADRVASADTFDNSRVEFWASALRVIADHPLAGVGVMNFPLHSGAVLPQTAEAPPHAHNLLLITATEIGILGALAMVAGLGALTWLLATTRQRTPGDRMLRSATLAGLAAAAVGGLFDGVIFHNVQTLMVAMVVIGMAAALTRWQADDDAPPSPPHQIPDVRPPYPRASPAAIDRVR